MSRWMIARACAACRAARDLGHQAERPLQRQVGGADEAVERGTVDVFHHEVVEPSPRGRRRRSGGRSGATSWAAAQASRWNRKICSGLACRPAIITLTATGRSSPGWLQR